MVRFPYFRMIWIPAVAGIPLFCSLYGWVHAAGMKPDVAAVIVEESKGETTVKVTNTDSAPALLHTVIKEVKPAPDNSASIIIAPPVARVEVQLVRIILQAPQPLKVEQYKRIVFEGIPQSSRGAETQVGFTVGQNLPLVIRPKGFAPNSEPWKSLVWSVDSGKRLQVNNPGPYVVRLSNALRILPDVGTRMLPQTYILPGETITLSQPWPAAGNASRQIKIEPVDDDGLPIRGGYTAPLAQTSGR